MGFPIVFCMQNQSGPVLRSEGGFMVVGVFCVISMNCDGMNVKCVGGSFFVNFDGSYFL